MKPLVRQTKDILAQRFGKKSVSVKQGTGNDSHWVEAQITLPPPETCTCTGADLCVECSRERDLAIRVAFTSLMDVPYMKHYQKNDESREHGMRAIQINVTIDHNHD